MRSFRAFEAGPDPFGRLWKVYFKWQQNAISLRHADTVDVKFVVETEDFQSEKVIALAHPDLLALSGRTGRPLDDSWCSHLAASHLIHMIETGEDIEKDLVTLTPNELAEAAGRLEAESTVAAR